jgi:signal transduction histidine kinase
LQEGAADEERALLSTIQTSSEFVASLLNQTLRLSRLALRKHGARYNDLSLMLDHSAFDLWQLLREVVSQHRPLAIQRQLALDVCAINAPDTNSPLIVWVRFECLNIFVS